MVLYYVSKQHIGVAIFICAGACVRACVRACARVVKPHYLTVFFIIIVH